MRLAALDNAVSPERIRNYSLLLVLGYVIGAVLWLGSMRDGMDPMGKPYGYDFITFYAASDLARQGQAALAYDPLAIFAAETAAVPANTMIFLWHYPPPFQLIVAPLAYVPYAAALVGWLAVTFALYLLLVRRLSDHRWTLLVGVAFGPVFLNAFHGQNAFLNVALLGFGLLWLDKRPWLAGVLLGLLIYKPHFGVLLPFLLLVQGRWKSIAGAAMSAIGLCAASYLAFGPEPWIAFFKNFDLVTAALERRFLPWPKIPSVFVAVADLGIPMSIAYVVHAAVALVLAVMTILAWRGPGPQTLKVALAIPAILSVSPYLFDYDLVFLAIPIGLLADYALRNPTPVGTRAALGLCFVAPILFIAIAEATRLHLMPVVMVLFYAAIWRTLQMANATERAGPQASPQPALA